MGCMIVEVGYPESLCRKATQELNGLCLIYLEAVNKTSTPYVELCTVKIIFKNNQTMYIETFPQRTPIKFVRMRTI